MVSNEIIEELTSKDNLSKNKKIKKRFLFYDSTLLHILSKNLLEGKIIFSRFRTDGRNEETLEMMIQSLLERSKNA